MSADLFQEPDSTVPLFDDAAPADPIVPKGDPVCVVCDAPLSWSGKGFRPKYCPDHRKARGGSAKSTDSAPGPATARPRQNAQVSRAIESIELLYGMAGTALRVTVSPTIGGALVDERRELAESYRMLMETNAAVRKWFTQVESKAAWLPILVAHSDLALNVMMKAKVEKMTRAAQTEWANQQETVPDPNGY